MPSEEHKLDALLDRYDNNDGRAGRELAALSASMRAQEFLLEVRSALLRRAPSNALQYVATLIGFHAFVEILLDTYVRSKDEAATLARKLLCVIPRFDAALLECARDEDVREGSNETVLRALDILDAVSEGERLVLSVSKFIRHPDAKLRSKAALFIARRRPNLHWVKDLCEESDARVRANIVESLYDVEEEFVTPLLRTAAADENNRVAGNAALGLYLRGDPASISLIDAMATHPRPQFRNTSAWVMGRTGDPRFADTLARQLSDSDELVRRQALRGLGEIKNAVKSARELSRLQIAILNHGSAQGRHWLAATVHNESFEAARHIPATRFFLKAGGRYIRQCAVQEIAGSRPVNSKFLLCLPAEEDGGLGNAFDDAMKRCARIQRQRDVITVTTALPAVDSIPPDLQLVVVGASPETQAIEALLDLNSHLRATIHIVAVSPPWQALKQRTNQLNGFFQSADERVDVAQACFQIYSALLHHYRLTWHDGEGNLELEIRCHHGTGGTGFSL